MRPAATVSAVRLDLRRRGGRHRPEGAAGAYRPGLPDWLLVVLEVMSRGAAWVVAVGVFGADASVSRASVDDDLCGLVLLGLFPGGVDGLPLGGVGFA